MILITGATGFLGAELARQLVEAGHQVRCTKRENSTIPKILLSYKSEIEWVNADVLDLSDLEDAFSGVTQVYHCAAKVSFDQKDEKQMNTTNVEGTANIVNLCLDFGARLVHVSSVAAIGNPKANEPVTERNFWDAYDKNGRYAISKYQSEMEVWRGIEEGLSAVIVNPSVIIGEHVGENGSGQLFELVAKGLKYYTKGNIGLVDVQDVATIMVKLMESNIENERFILNAENYSYERLFKEIAKSYSVNTDLKPIARWKLNLAVRLSLIAKLFVGNIKGLTQDVVAAAFNQTLYSSDKVKETLQVQFLPLAESIERTAKGIS
ncbi:NAD-dependent epimerase/dehydratase [Pseudopedobacter saltans DSM 12145]|uniref:NAD-dependent epimerase/dehydratase n=1 Tax=Pseudopedobacter saltans (strain ATCC 51119 / DSM 12145 / JCM 21818 / CCUG 39354 / LMG 10337 / NBRC 100064 / NCIMB 13643) TaxID=762903 RepID=F0SF24_PSESL|nr:SDR family NAD(P)-dependent oxidoreductase [Pseudopedobacter saltans]ADY54092.1 NAD-dependent epimerase/dehydratase [Pseudopedobacter saltans DSM 12145]